MHHKIFLRPDSTLQERLKNARCHGKPVRLIVVGSFRTGGAGKTPFCLWLAQRVHEAGASAAILCHSYAYDEIRMLSEEASRLKMPQIKVIGTPNRHKAVLSLLEQEPPEYIICDDGFEDTRLTGAETIILNAGPAPKSIRDLWPLGNCRSLAKDHTTDNISLSVPEDIFFTIESIANSSGPLQQNSFRRIHIFCGLGDPMRFVHDVEAFGIHICEKHFAKDHEKKFASRLMDALKKAPNDAFIISLKDSCRLSKEQLTNPHIFIARQKTTVGEHAEKKLEPILRVQR